MLLSYLYRTGGRLPTGAACAAVVLLWTSPAVAQTAALKNNSPVLAVQRWVAAIDAHVPGELDAPVATYAALKPSERGVLVSIAGQFTFYLRHLNEIAEPPKVRLSPLEKTLITALANRIREKDTFAEWLHRAVMFETDTAMLAPEVTAAAMRDAKGTGMPEAIHAEDGEAGARDLLNWHWKMARDLVDLRDPAASDVFAAAWYHAVALYQLDMMLLGEMGPHMLKAFQTFPNDALIQFDDACFADAMGSARVQAVMIGARPRDFRPNIPSGASADDQATAQFLRVLSMDLTFAEPRVRLARLLEKNGKAKDALTLLAATSRLQMSPELEYMSHLIAARASGALGLTDDGIAHAKAARQLFSTAQSPLVALSQLALEAGDTVGAVAAASEMRLNADRSERDDPWWSYFQASWLDARALLDALRLKVRR